MHRRLLCNFLSYREVFWARLMLRERMIWLQPHWYQLIFFEEHMTIFTYFVSQVHNSFLTRSAHTACSVNIYIESHSLPHSTYVYWLCLLIFLCARMRSKPKSEPRPTGRFLCLQQTSRTSLFLCTHSYVHFAFILFYSFYFSICKLLDRKFNWLQ